MDNVRQYFNQKLDGIYTRSEIGILYRRCMQQVCKIPYSECYFHKDTDFDEKEAIQLKSMADRLSKSEPIDYVLGECEFLGLKFRLDERVLIPRPETQELADLIITRWHSAASPSVLDLCCGSGCLSVSLCCKLNQARVTAVDVSDAALQVAEENAALNHTRVEFIKADLLNVDADFLCGRQFDVVCCNPPYVRECEKIDMQPNVLDYEPHLALFVTDDDPLIFYRAAAKLLCSHLAADGAAYFEINQYLAPQTAAVFTTSGFKAQIVKDLSVADRFVIVSR